MKKEIRKENTKLLSKTKKPIYRILKIVGICLVSLMVFTGICLGVLLYVVFTPKRLTPVVNSVINSTIHADFHCESVDVTFFHTFPNFSIRLKNGSVLSNACYQAEQTSNSYLKKDSLISFSVCYLSFDPIKLYWNNELIVKEILLEDNYIHAVIDSSGKANWDIFSSESDSDSSQFNLLSLFSSLALEKVVIKSGQFIFEDFQNKVRLQLDQTEIRLSGQWSEDILTFDMDFKTETIDLKQAETTWTLRPGITFRSKFTIDSQKGIYTFSDTQFNWNGLEFETNGYIQSTDFKTIETNLDFHLYTPAISVVKKIIPQSWLPILKKFSIDGILDMKAHIQGIYGKGQFPVLTAQLHMQNGSFQAKGLPKGLHALSFELETSIDLQNKSNSHLRLHHFFARWPDSQLYLNGNIESLLTNAHVTAHVKSHLDLAEIGKYIPFPQGMELNGLVDADIKALFQLENLKNFQPDKIQIKGELSAQKIIYKQVQNQHSFIADTLFVLFQPHNTNHLPPFGKKSVKAEIKIDRAQYIAGNQMEAAFKHLTSDIQCILPKKIDLTDIQSQVQIDSLVVYLPDSIRFYSEKTLFKGSLLPEKEKINHIQGYIRTENSLLRKGNSLDVTSNELGLKCDLMFNAAVSAIPFLDISLHTRGSSLILPKQKCQLNSSGFQLKTYPLSDTGKFPLQKISPQNSFDTILKVIQAISVGGYKKMAELMHANISLKLEGLSLPAGYLPLDIDMSRCDLSANNNNLNINNIDISSGSSSINIKGTMDSLPQAIFEQGIFQGSFKLTSKQIDCNEILQAFLSTSQINTVPQEKEVSIKEVTQTPLLIAVPENIHLKIQPNIETLLYNKAHFKNVTGQIVIHHQHVLLDNLHLVSDLGEIKLLMLYEATTTEKAVAAVNLYMNKVDIRKLIDNIPMVDTLLPMLRSFEGIINCQIVATTVFDSMLRINIPATKASCYVHGKNLVVLDGATFTNISKRLFFKNKNRNLIDSLSVEFFMRENKIVFFPFPLQIDRYRVMISGVQNANMSFDYHLSLLQSPLPFRFGLNIRGNPNEPRFILSKARYKNLAKNPDDYNIRNYSNQRKQLYDAIMKSIDDIIGSSED